MGVQVNQAWRNNVTSNIADFGFPGGLERLANRRNLAILEGDIGDGIQFLGGVNDMPAPKNEIIGQSALLPCFEFQISRLRLAAAKFSRQQASHDSFKAAFRRLARHVAAF